MKLYIYKCETTYRGEAGLQQDFIISTIPHSRMDIERGWGNMPKVVEIVRLNEYGARDETAPYRLFRVGPFELSNYIAYSDLTETSWLDILVTTGFTKAMVTELLKKGKYANFHGLEDTINSL